MITQRIYTLLLVVFVSFSLMAQDEETQKKEINRVKLHPGQYLYAEVVAADRQSALDLAEEYLQTKISEYVAEKKKLGNGQSVVALDTKRHWETISMARGTNMFRAFMYVKKSDIIPAENATLIEPMKATVQPLSNREETIEKLLELKQFSELETCIKQLKQEERITEYAKIKNLKNLEDYVLLIYNREGEIEAVLSEGIQRTNLRTKKEDSTENYKGRGAIGIKVAN